MDGLQIIAVVFLFLLALYWLGTYHFAIIKSFNIPGPNPLPFVGNIPDIWKYGSVFNTLFEYRKRYGKVFHISLGQQTSIVVADPDLLKLITVKEFDKFRNRFLPFPPVPPNHLGIFFAADGDWKRIRSTLTPTFSGSKMKQMVPIIENSCDVLIAKFRQAADTGKIVDINQLCQQYALEVVMSSAFGLETNIQTEPQKELVDNVVKVIGNRPMLLMILQSLPFYTTLKRFLGHITKAAIPVQYMNEIAYQIINHRKQKGIDLGRKDLLHLILTTTDKKGDRILTDDEISAQPLAFLVAGLHTISTTLKIFLYYLAHFPDLQEQLYEEVENAFQANPDKPIYDLVQELEYLDCFFNEVLRIRNRYVAGIFERECSESCTLNGVHFPAGTSVILSYPLLQFDDEYWNDPFQFDPERFRGPAKEQRPPHVFNPFGMGPRNCIGMRMAQMEIRITIVRLVKELKFVLSPKAKRPLNDLIRDLVELRIEHRHK